MRARQHCFWGGIAGAATALLPYYTSFFACRSDMDNIASLAVSAAIGLGIGGAGAGVPDVLEPAKHPSHRKFFHSWLAFVIVGAVGYLIALEHIHLNYGVRWLFVLPAIAGYICHLFTDAFSPKGLPLY